MMFLAPGYFIAACVVAAAVVALHFLETRDPRTSVFPTVRFVPQAQVRSFAPVLRLTDVLLLLLRVAIVLLLGAALAQPHVPLISKEVARIVVVDVSRAVKKDDSWRALVREQAADAAAIVTFGATAREIRLQQLETMLGSPATSAESAQERGSLSAGLIASLRAASRLRDRAESVELLLVSPLVEEELDEATLRIRALWPGGMTIRRVAAAPAQAPLGESEATVPQVEWAEAGDSAFWVARSRSDTIGGVRAGDATLIHSFERRWQLKQPLEANTRVIARWIDGEPAAIEQTTGAQNPCVRSIAFFLPRVGDAGLRPDFVRFVRGLEAPCGESRDPTPLGTQLVAALEGTENPALSASVAAPVRQMTPPVPWLLLAALALLALEYPVRKLSRPRPPAAPELRESSSG